MLSCDRSCPYIYMYIFPQLPLSQSLGDNTGGRLVHGGRSFAPIPERGPEGVSQGVRRQSNKTQINPSAEARKEEAGPINCSWANHST